MLDAQWLVQLRQQADRPPVHARVPLWVAGQRVGSVDARIATRLGDELNASSAVRALAPLWCPPPPGGADGLHLSGEGLQARLDALALGLREIGLARSWRHEALALCSAAGERLGQIERGVVRILGLRTQAVHLVGQSPDGRHWVQQRAHDKDSDPGLWDTLMGGMVPASDSVDDALRRETWEEAGLHVQALQALQHGGTLRLQKPLPHTPGQGYVVEDVDWFHAVVPDGMEPCNQDGEVDHFECIDTPELVRRLHAGLFTTEAAMILVAALGASV